MAFGSVVLFSYSPSYSILPGNEVSHTSCSQSARLSCVTVACSRIPPLRFDDISTSGTKKQTSFQKYSIMSSVHSDKWTYPPTKVYSLIDNSPTF